MKDSTISIGAVLDIIFKTTNKRVSILADRYLLKDRTIIYKWRNKTVRISENDMNNIVEFAVNESSYIQRNAIRDKIVCLIENSDLRQDIKNELIDNNEDFSKFLQEVLKTTAVEFEQTLVDSKDERQKDSMKAFTLLPTRATNKFVGREKELGELEARLNEKNAAVLVKGIGGIGKTEICKRLFWNNRERYDFIGWIDYVSGVKESFVNQITIDGLKFTEEAKLDEKFSQLIRRLYNFPSNSLLIVDNLEENHDEAMKAILSLPFKVLATSRVQIEGFDIYNLEMLDDKKCLELFYNHYQGTRDDKSLAKIIRFAGNHTLTIELLAKAANNAAMEIKELLGNLTNIGFDLRREVKETISASWNYSYENYHFFNHLLKVFNMSSLNPSEKYILANMSILPATYIEIKELRQWLCLNSNNDINMLVKKGWLKQEGFSICMHRVIQEIAQYELKPDIVKCGKLMEALADKLELQPEENPIHKRKYVPYGSSILEYLYEEDENIANLANNASVILEEMGEYKEALKYQLKAVEIREKILEKDHSDLARSYNTLTGIHYHLGDVEEALIYGKRALEIYKKSSEKSYWVGQLYSTLAWIYRAKGELGQFQECILNSIGIFEKVLEEDHPELVSINILRFFSQKSH
ncbi:MAG: tetratricopeptide repeat protein [Clostridia bacterium]|nr:tetratricopeptide repeat protein [Clostridia bacterium]